MGNSNKSNLRKAQSVPDTQRLPPDAQVLSKEKSYSTQRLDQRERVGRPGKKPKQQTQADKQQDFQLPPTEAAFLPAFPLRGDLENLDFEVIEVIAKGAYGNVIKVQREDEKRFYAIKVMDKGQILREGAVNQCKDEASIQSMVGEHPFVVKAYEYWQSQRNLYIVLEYIPYGDMFTLWTFHGCFPEDLVRLYIAEMSIIIDYLHNACVIYRDVKMENILFDPRGHIQLTDFGLAKWLQRGDTTRTVCGTLQYMAPEVLSVYSYDHSADWWSLGILMFAMLTGRYPVDGVETHTRMAQRVFECDYLLPSHISDSAQDVVNRVLTKSPHKRLNDVSVFQDLHFFQDIVFSDLVDKRINPIDVVAEDFFPMTGNSYAPQLLTNEDQRNFAGFDGVNHGYSEDQYPNEPGGYSYDYPDDAYYDHYDYREDPESRDTQPDNEIEYRHRRDTYDGYVDNTNTKQSHPRKSYNDTYYSPNNSYSASGSESKPGYYETSGVDTRSRRESDLSNSSSQYKPSVVNQNTYRDNNLSNSRRNLYNGSNVEQYSSDLSERNEPSDDGQVYNISKAVADFKRSRGINESFDSVATSEVTTTKAYKSRYGNNSVTANIDDYRSNQINERLSQNRSELNAESNRVNPHSTNTKQNSRPIPAPRNVNIRNTNSSVKDGIRQNGIGGFHEAHKNRVEETEKRAAEVQFNIGLNRPNDSSQRLGASIEPNILQRSAVAPPKPPTARPRQSVKSSPNEITPPNKNGFEPKILHDTGPPTLSTTEPKDTRNNYRHSTVEFKTVEAPPTITLPPTNNRRSLHFSGYVSGFTQLEQPSVKIPMGSSQPNLSQMNLDQKFTSSNPQTATVENKTISTNQVASSSYHDFNLGSSNTALNNVIQNKPAVGKKPTPPKIAPKPKKFNTPLETKFVSKSERNINSSDLYSSTTKQDTTFYTTAQQNTSSYNPGHKDMSLYNPGQKDISPYSTGQKDTSPYITGQYFETNDTKLSNSSNKASSPYSPERKDSSPYSTGQTVFFNRRGSGSTGDTPVTSPDADEDSFKWKLPNNHSATYI